MSHRAEGAPCYTTGVPPLVAVLTAALVCALPGPDPGPPPGAPLDEPAALIAEGDRLLEQGDEAGARQRYEAAAARWPGTPAARDAARALWFLDHVRLGSRAPALGAPPVDNGSADFYALEPYSRRTGERLHATAWEKVDFAFTAFLYGLSTGAAIGFALDDGNVAPAAAIAGLAYGSLAVAMLGHGHYDRGDLPVALAIAAYVPTTLTLIAVANDWRGTSAAAATGIAGLIALPIAAVVANTTNADPGDAQLVRDAGFWGAALSILFAAGADAPSQTVGLAGLGGLYGGLGLGLLVASKSEVTVERVRVITWSGYAGTVVGALLGSGGNSNGFLTTAAAGAGVGLLIGAAISPRIDDPPARVRLVDDSVASVEWFRPAPIAVTGRDGRVGMVPGLSIAAGRF
jgi:hypothetical protein